MAKITFNDKSYLNQNPSIADENKVNDSDMNELKYGTNDILSLLGLLVDNYNTSSSYSAGEKVIYNNQIYMCTGSTTGSWDSSKWVLLPLFTNEMNINLELNPDIYSTSETKTNKKFLDKDVYRRMYLITTTNNSNITQAHGLTNLDHFWVNYDASYIFDGNESLPPNWYYSSNDWGRLWVNSTSLRFRSPGNLGTRTVYAVVEYTKNN